MDKKVTKSPSHQVTNDSVIGYRFSHTVNRQPPTGYALLRPKGVPSKVEGRSLLVFILTWLILLQTLSYAAEPLIVDHNAVQEFEQIPAEWLDCVKNMFLIHTGQSHGFQVPRGLEELEFLDNIYDVEITTGDYPAGTDVFKISRGLLSQYNSWINLLSPDSYWNTESGLDNVRRTLNYYRDKGIKVDAILHTWCWHLRTWSKEQLDAYFSALGTLEAEYPEVTFVYMTDTADYNSGYGYNRHQRNDEIRQYCLENNKVLFDFGELECWSLDGTEENTYDYIGRQIPVWHQDWSSGAENYYGHINKEGVVMKAKAMWWLMARLAGWEGVTDDNFTLGDVSGNGLINTYDASLTAQYAVGLITLTDKQKRAADVSGQNEINTHDASLIAKHAVRLIRNFAGQ